jgi:hypothetical protein
MKREKAQWQQALDVARQAAVEFERAGVRVTPPGRP